MKIFAIIFLSFISLLCSCSRVPESHIEKMCLIYGTDLFADAQDTYSKKHYLFGDAGVQPIVFSKEFDGQYAKIVVTNRRLSTPLSQDELDKKLLELFNEQQKKFMDDCKSSINKSLHKCAANGQLGTCMSQIGDKLIHLKSHSQYHHEKLKVDKVISDRNGLKELLKRGDYEQVEKVIQSGVDVNGSFVRVNEDELKAVWTLAVDGNDKKMMAFLLKNGLDLSLYDDSKWGPIQSAVQKGKYSIANVLVKKHSGTPVDANIMKERVANCMMYDQTECLRFAFENGVDVNETLWKKRRVWPLASSHFSRLSPESVAVVLKSGLKLTPPEKFREKGKLNGAESLLAKHLSGDQEETSERLEVTKLLLEAGGDPKERDYLNQSIFEKVVRNEHLKTIKLFCSHGVKASFDRKILDKAIATKSIDMVKAVVNCGAKVNIRGKKKFTERDPLELAYHTKNQEIIKYLKSKGARVRKR